MGELDTSRFDLPEIHRLLTENCTQRYLGRLRPLHIFTTVEKFRQGSPASDYATTSWEALPNLALGAFATYAVCAYLRTRRKTLNGAFSHAFEEQLNEELPLTDALMDYPVAIIGGHEIDFQGLPIINGLAHAIARRQPESYRRARHDIANATHVAMHRAFLPMRVGHDWSPYNPESLTMLSLLRAVANPIFTLPPKSAREAGIEQDFIDAYNFEATKDCLSTVKKGTQHPAGYEQAWIMLPSGSPDEKVSDHRKVKKVAKRVNRGTKRLVRNMKVGVLPVYTSLRKGSIVVEAGQIIPPNEVTDSTIPEIMSELAWFRRQHGEEGVYYAEDDEVAALQ